MIPLNITLDAEGRYPEATDPGSVTSVGRLPRGTASGKSAVIVEITKPDGTRVYGQTTMALFQGTATVFHAAEGE